MKLWRSVPPDPTFPRPQSCHLWTWALEWLLWLDGGSGGGCRIGINRNLKKCCNYWKYESKDSTHEWDCQPQRVSIWKHGFTRVHDRLVEAYPSGYDIWDQKRALLWGWECLKTGNSKNPTSSSWWVDCIPIETCRVSSSWSGHFGPAKRDHAGSNNGFGWHNFTSIIQHHLNIIRTAVNPWRMVLHIFSI